MSLSLLVNNTECGPGNALQGLSKRFDNDRGIQQDHFGAGQAGPSRQTFRTQSAPGGRDAEAARFFSGAQASQPDLAHHPSPFDVSELQRSLPYHHTPQSQTHKTFASHEPAMRASASSAWAADFLQMGPASSSSAMQPQVHTPPTTSSSTSGAQGFIHRNPGPQYMNQMGNHTEVLISGLPAQPYAHRHVVDWDKEFQMHEATLAPEQTAQETVSKPVIDDNELARTAGMLIDHVKGEQNPKFQKSQFLTLMRQLRDHEVVVDGDKMVEVDQASDIVAHSSAKGKGKAATEGPGLKGLQEAELLIPSGDSMASAQFDAVIRERVGNLFNPSAASTTSSQLDGMMVDERMEETETDRYLREENEAYRMFWGEAGQQAPIASTSTAQAQEWGALQDQWDRFEVTNTGIKPVSAYVFQTHNPYLNRNASSTTRNHAMHAPGMSRTLSESVLELEAAAQESPGDAAVWYELGVKQQENEREQKAIEALERAAELDPSYISTYLALAISYTNDSNRTATHKAISEWVHRNSRYQDIVTDYRAQHSVDPQASITQKFQDLIDCLITIVRSDAEGQLDADVQIALAVLLNTNEEYLKAQDCFRAALSARPEDWLLYNRVGATLANSGNPSAAIEYYTRALELNPGYIRARFNLGISCINLRRYDEAAHYILDALTLQEGDHAPDPSGFNEKRGVTSKALWDSLKTACLHMQKIELATLCDHCDLERFRAAYYSQA